MTRRRWWLLGALVVVLWAAVSGLFLVRAAGDLRTGRASAQAARDGVDAKSIADGRPLPALRKAHARFRAAASTTGSPLFLPVRFLPIAGRQLRSVHAMAVAARDVTAAAVDAVAQAHEVLRRPSTGSSARLAQVRALSDAVTKASKRVNAVHDLGPRKGLVGPLVDARNQLSKQLAEAKNSLDAAAAGAVAGLRLLEGPHRYLLVAANTAEMRAGSGTWLSGGVLETSAGRLHLGPVSPLYQQAEPPEGKAPPIADADLFARWGAVWAPSVDWRALMVSPRMPASAALGLRMWQAAGRGPLDGLLVVDPIGLAAVLRATGPVRLGDRTVTADEVPAELLHDQYLQFSAATPEQRDRREALGGIASAAFASLDAGGWSPTTLAAELAKAVKGRHLMAWSGATVEQRGWAAAGMSGDLRPDSLFVSVLNRGGNKLDYFLPADGRVATRPVGPDTEVTVTLDLHNVTPAGQPHYVAGPPYGQHWEPGRYVGVVAVDVPAAARDVRIVGVDRPVAQGPDGAAQVVATGLELPAGQSQQLVVTFRMPGRHGHVVIEPSARFPGITWHHGSRSWQDFGGERANW
jgi:hypothetical protein